MTTALVPASRTVAVYDRIADPIEASNQLAKAAASMLGAPPEQGPAIALHALCEGLTLVEMRRRYHWISGAPSKRADAMLAEFRMNHGGKYEIHARTPELAHATFTAADGSKYEAQLSIEDLNASRFPWKDWKDHAKGYKDNYATPLDRKAMLWARMVSDALRVVCPELVAGVYTPEELRDTVDAPPRAEATGPTIDEMMRQAQAADVVDAEEAVVDAVDAEFIAEPAAAPVAEPEDPSAPGTVSQRQADRIDALFTELGIPHEKQVEALAKRQASVVRNLSSDDAQGLIDRLEAIKVERGN